MIALAPALWVSRASAQEFRSTLSGVVRDSGGRVIPKAPIQAVNVDTGANVSTVTGDTGEFTLPFLPPGRYTVSCEVSGFKKFSQKDVAITADQRVSLDIVLQVGSITETVTVSAGAKMLATGTASVGQSVVSEHLADMPMAGRAPMVMTRLAMGVADQANPAYNPRPFDTSGTSTYSIGGGRSTTNELLLDGLPNMANYRVVAYNPPIDAAEEVRVEVFESDAAYGDTGGGTINIITKSGTNLFHGTIGEFNQTGSLSANQFFLNAAGIKRPVSRYNQWGGSASGPVWIPKVFDGKNKLFWFFDYDAISDFRPSATVSTTLTVPTPAMRNGDFSGLLPYGTAYQLYDPSTAVAVGTRRHEGAVPRQHHSADPAQFYCKSLHAILSVAQPTRPAQWATKQLPGDPGGPGRLLELPGPLGLQHQQQAQDLFRGALQLETRQSQPAFFGHYHGRRTVSHRLGRVAGRCVLVQPDDVSER